MTEPEEKKLIIDEDWKTQVQREKAMAEARKADDKEGSEPATAESAPKKEPSRAPAPEAPVAEKQAESSDDAGSPQGSDPDEPEMPPASLIMLISTLAAQAMACLGDAPPELGEQPVRPKLARHYIDTLAILEKKTDGNLDDEEKTYLAAVLSQLRMAYVSIANASRGQ